MCLISWVNFEQRVFSFTEKMLNIAMHSNQIPTVYPLVKGSLPISLY